MRTWIVLALLFLASPVQTAFGQQCLGRPLEAGDQAVAARIDLDRFVTVAAEYSTVGESVAWHALGGVVADELIPPGEFEPAFGGGLAWSGLHPAFCPAASFQTSKRPAGNDRLTFVDVGIGLGRRLGADRVWGTAFLFPHLRLVDEFESSRREGWIEGGFALRGERFWGLAVVGLQVAGPSPGEDVPDGSARFASGVAF